MHEFIITGFSDEIDPDITKQFEHLNKLNINYFEPRGINGKNIADLNDDEVSELLSEMKKYGIKVSSIGSPIGKTDIKEDFEAELKRLDRVITIAKALGTSYIRIFSFYNLSGISSESFRDEAIARLKQMAALAEKRNITLLHENEKEIFGENAVNCLDILKSVNSDFLKAVFDPANFIQCGQDTLEAFDMLKDYVVYMHIKDALPDGKVVPAGYGAGNVRAILAKLAADGYKGFLSLEPHLGSFKGLESLELDDNMLELDGSTPEKFTLAYISLKAITDSI